MDTNSGITVSATHACASVWVALEGGGGTAANGTSAAATLGWSANEESHSSLGKLSGAHRNGRVLQQAYRE